MGACQYFGLCWKEESARPTGKGTTARWGVTRRPGPGALGGRQGRGVGVGKGGSTWLSVGEHAARLNFEEDRLN
jgi:hypothetical protein